MAIVRQNPKKNLKQEWTKYSETVAIHVSNGNVLIANHNHRADGVIKMKSFLEDIPLIKPLLATLIKIKNDLIIYKNKFERKRNSTSNTKDIDDDLEHLKYVQFAVIMLIIELNKIIADKYLTMSKVLKKLDKKIEHVENAYKYIQTARIIFNEYEDFILDPNNPHQQLIKNYRLTLIHIEEAYHIYFNNSEDPIQKLISEAQQSKFLRSKKLKEALALAEKTNSVEKKFLILIQLGQTNAHEIIRGLQHEKMSLQDVKSQYILLKEMSSPYIEAAEIALMVENNELIDAHAKSCYMDLCFVAEELLKLTTVPAIAKDLELQEEYLAEAKKYFELSEKLAHKVQENFDKLNCVREELNTATVTLNDAKEKALAAKLANDLLEKEQMKLAKLQKEYDEKFNSAHQKNKPKKKHFYQTLDTPEPQLLEDISEAEDLALIEITFSEQEFQFTHLIWDLGQLTDHLAAATARFDVLEQIRLNTTFAEYYLIQAFRFISRITQVKEGIDQLEQAKKFLADALAIIKINTGLDVQLDSARKWVEDILNKADLLLTKTLHHQINVKKRFDNGHKAAKEHIILTYGEDAWFKFKSAQDPADSNKPEFDFSLLSPNAQIRLNAKSNIWRLRKMNASFRSIDAELKLNHEQENRQLAAKSQRPTKTNEKSVYVKNNLFRETRLSRTTSLDSFLNEKEMEIRWKKRSGFGR